MLVPFCRNNENPLDFNTLFAANSCAQPSPVPIVLIRSEPCVLSIKCVSSLIDRSITCTAGRHHVICKISFTSTTTTTSSTRSAMKL